MINIINIDFTYTAPRDIINPEVSFHNFADAGIFHFERSRSIIW